jgi:hypothetical protein
MMPHSSLKRWLCRTYAVLLYAYPREFRLRYGGEMEQLFRDRCRAVAMTQSLRGLLRFGAHGGADWLITTIGEWIVTMRSATPSTVRIALLVGITLSLTMMGISVFLYRPLLAMPGGPTYVLETTVALVAYGSLIVWATRSNGSLRGTVLLLGTPVGLIAAAVQIVHLVTENFVHFGAPWEGITTLTFMLGTFLLWGVAGYRCARSIGAAGPAAVAGSWSAVVTMSILVTFGFALELYLAVPKPEYVGTWREFKRSGWTDVHAFTIANALDAALSRFIIGPIVGAIFGGAAGVIARLRGKGQSNPALGLQ